MPCAAPWLSEALQEESGTFKTSPAVCEAAADYCPRNPAESILYRVVAAELENFLERQRLRDRHVPRFVERELRSFLDCGILARGFLRVQCDACRLDRVVPYSCKCRGYAELMNMRSTVT
jgi:hypothetical protein